MVRSTKGNEWTLMDRVAVVGPGRWLAGKLTGAGRDSRLLFANEATLGRYFGKRSLQEAYELEQRVTPHCAFPPCSSPIPWYVVPSFNSNGPFGILASATVHSTPRAHLICSFGIASARDHCALPELQQTTPGLSLVTRGNQKLSDAFHAHAIVLYTLLQLIS